MGSGVQWRRQRGRHVGQRHAVTLAVGRSIGGAAVIIQHQRMSDVSSGGISPTWSDDSDLA
eukprot:4999797-Pleurochrysis_carterae.AAC.1